MPQLPVGTIHLYHLDVVIMKKAGQAGPIRAGALHPDPEHAAELVKPSQQLVIARRGGLERRDAEHAAEVIQHGGDMEIGVGIDTATDDTGIYDGHQPSLSLAMCAKGWHAPPERRTSMRSKLLPQPDRRHTARPVSAGPRSPGTVDKSLTAHALTGGQPVLESGRSRDLKARP